MPSTVSPSVRLGLAVSLAALFAVGCRERGATPPKPAPSALNTAPAEAPLESIPSAAQARAAGEPANAATARQTPHAPPTAPPFDTSGAWTTRRMFVLAERGPIVIDLSLSSAQESLEEAGTRSAEAIAAEIRPSPEKGLAWKELLDHPLVASGWLGNLVADEQQRNQLVSMYDQQNNEMVEPEELAAFLSRGLSRGPRLQLTDAGSEPDSSSRRSPWGRIDLNQDRTLDANELQQVDMSLAKFDFNGDRLISRSELNEAASMENGMSNMTASTLLQSRTLIIRDPVEEELQDQQRLDKRLVQQMLEHYSFLGKIGREQWTLWSEQLWAQLDLDRDGSVDKLELLELLDQPPHIHLYVRFPDVESQQVALESHAVFAQEWFAAEAGTRSWTSHAAGGQLHTPQLVIDLNLSDSFATAARRAFSRRLEQAAKNAPLRAFVENQLDLRDSAWEVADANGDGEFDEAEIQQIWKWVSLRQRARAVGRWRLAAEPWFLLLDRNGDERIDEKERTQADQWMVRLDADGNQRITPNEMPLCVRFALEREESRLATNPTTRGGAPPDTDSMDWHSAMDTNNDGMISRSEFLGDASDFGHWDRNNDGFVTRVEVYGGSDSY